MVAVPDFEAGTTPLASTLTTDVLLLVQKTDFGLADTDCHSYLKGPAGTPAYAAPEMIEGADFDCRSDIASIQAALKRHPHFLLIAIVAITTAAAAVLIARYNDRSRCSAADIDGIFEQATQMIEKANSPAI